MGYTIIIEPAPEGGFWAFAPLLPGCISEGDTFEEVRRNMTDAIRGYLAVLAEDGDPAPEESSERIVTSVAAV